MVAPYPFAAIVGQTEMTTALLLAAIEPRLGGVLVLGDRGTGKSTAVRALAAALPPIERVAGCPYNRPFADDDGDAAAQCPSCSERVAAGETLTAETVTVPVVDLPLGATQDRLVGALDLEAALTRGEKRFEPGLLANANRGFLYIDEINLLEDHLVDLLLDVAASGENIVEREGVSMRHDARFVLIGSGNPEEGELRPQLLDRFGLSVDVTTTRDVAERIAVLKRRAAYDADPEQFCADWARETEAVRERVTAARARLAGLTVADAALEQAVALCAALGTDGLRGELTLTRAARALAAYQGAQAVTWSHIKDVAPLALSHRLRRDPLDDVGSVARVERAVVSIDEAGANSSAGAIDATATAHQVAAE
ncbi:MAG: magnesium chelatase ATPase subunit I [Pseudomonadota bacterium]